MECLQSHFHCLEFLKLFQEIFLQVLRLAISEAPDEESAKQLRDLEVHTKKSLRGQVPKLKPEEFEVLYAHATDVFNSIVEGTYRQEAEAVLGGMFDRTLAER